MGAVDPRKLAYSTPVQHSQEKGNGEGTKLDGFPWKMENLWGLSLPACLPAYQGNPACHQRGTKTSFEAGETELAKSALGFWQEHRLPLQQRRNGKVISDHLVAQGVWVADKGIHFFIGT